MNFSYYLPTKIVFGFGALSGLMKEVENLGGTRIFVVTDKVMEKTGIMDKVTLQLGEIPYEIFDGVEPEPRIEVAENVATSVRSSRFDLVIGVGGGSVLDMAKLAAGLVTNEGEARSYVGFDLFRRKGIPSIMIPTTSGTGSEVTVTSMVTVEGHKQWINSPFLLPSVALVDPELTLTMPPNVTASTGLDALCHCTEAYLSKGANPITDSVALEGIRLIVNSLEKAYRDSSDKLAREAMSLAALFGGIALAARMVYGHSIGYTIATRFNLPHGVSCAIPLPYIIANCSLACAPKMKKLAEAYCVLGGDDPVSLGFTIGEKVREMIAGFEIHTSLKELGVKQDDLPMLAKECIELYYRNNSPVVFDEKSMTHFYRIMWEGTLTSK